MVRRSLSSGYHGGPLTAQRKRVDDELQRVDGSDRQFSSQGRQKELARDHRRLPCDSIPDRVLGQLQLVASAPGSNPFGSLTTPRSGPLLGRHLPGKVPSLDRSGHLVGFPRALSSDGRRRQMG